MPSESPRSVEVAIVGAGIAGIATAYALCQQRGGGRRDRKLELIDPLPPMSLTSAQSGDNYRSWWPHPTMAAFTGRSIELMERLARDSGNALAMTRRGYALATRSRDIDPLLSELRAGGAGEIRIHDRPRLPRYRPPLSADWQAAPDGVDVITDQSLIRRTFPSFDPTVAAVVHVRRAGDINGQQLGQLMLERVRERGGRLLRAGLRGARHDGGWHLDLVGDDGPQSLRAETVVIAAGPCVGAVAALLGATLPLRTVLQQKIAFEDREGAIPRDQPFAVDLDARTLEWTEEERTLLAEDPETSWLTQPMPGSIHCRPDGGDRGRWIKLGWAYNRTASGPCEAPELDPRFPEIVLRGAAALNPGLRAYYGRLPRGFSHCGGYYAITEENWPLVGPLGEGIEGGFVVGALSGFGTMAACAAGELCAAWIDGGPLPAYARDLSPARSGDAALMAELTGSARKGVL